MRSPPTIRAIWFGSGVGGMRGQKLGCNPSENADHRAPRLCSRLGARETVGKYATLRRPLASQQARGRTCRRPRLRKGRGHYGMRSPLSARQPLRRWRWCWLQCRTPRKPTPVAPSHGAASRHRSGPICSTWSQRPRVSGDHMAKMHRARSIRMPTQPRSTSPTAGSRE